MIIQLQLYSNYCSSVFIKIIHQKVHLCNKPIASFTQIQLYSNYCSSVFIKIIHQRSTVVISQMLVIIILIVSLFMNEMHIMLREGRTNCKDQFIVNEFVFRRAFTPKYPL